MGFTPHSELEMKRWLSFHRMEQKLNTSDKESFFWKHIIDDVTIKEIILGLFEKALEEDW